MKITTFTKLVTQDEGLKESISIAQVAEVLKIVNKRTGGLLYFAIRFLSKK